jgi:hypothetical protein
MHLAFLHQVIVHLLMVDVNLKSAIERYEAQSHEISWLPVIYCTPPFG